MAYTTVNYRLHCYLTYAKMNWEPDVIASVLPRTYDCTFCGLKMLTFSTKDTHQFYCPANPKGAKNRLKRKSEDLLGEPRICCLCGKPYKNPSSYRTHISHPHKKM
ncbi:hypothetical protein PI126_g20612 [Phytophthora idaei]|nr:hypothetical protein PI126_g20612 [Phytophthora idaei]